MDSGPQLYHPDDYTGGAPSNSGVAAGSAVLGGLNTYNQKSGGSLTKKLRSLLSGSGGGGGGLGSDVQSTADAEGSAGYKRGGLVRKTRKAMVHKGEFVLTAAQVKALKRKKRKQGRGARR